jgi:hypothetical protein
MILSSTSDILRIVTTGTPDIDVQAGWADLTATALTAGRTNTKISSATTTTVIASPGASTQRQVKTIVIRNIHATNPNTVTVQHYDGSVSVNVYAATLAAGESVQYDGTSWSYYNSSGALTSVTTSANLSGDVSSVGTVTTIGAKKVTVAMLADGTDGQLITWDAAGVAAVVPVGTATHVLTSNGAGAAPTFQAAPAGGAAVADIGSTAETVGGSVANGTAATASRSDHKHAITNPKIDDLATADDNTDLNANTTNHGLLLKATAPAAGLMNFVGLTNAETAYTNKPLFDATVPTTIAPSDAAAAGTATVAARRDHLHAAPATFPATAHNLFSTTHGDSTGAASPVDGDIIIGNVTPKWSKLAISIPAANLINVLGIVNGELRPSWKALLDATNPAAIGSAAPGTATTAAHRDHVHAIPANGVTLAMLATQAADTVLANATAGAAVPSAVALTEQTVLGMITGGHIAALTVAQLATLALSAALPENVAIILDAALSADGKYSGITEAGTAGAALAFGDLVYLAVADSRWELADSDAEVTSGPVKLGICVLAAAGDASATTILLYGKVRADAAFPAMTIGAPLYIGATAVDIVVAAPGTGKTVRIVGYANTADELYFKPDNTWVVL